jgi:hypothetical protein
MEASRYVARAVSELYTGILAASKTSLACHRRDVNETLFQIERFLVLTEGPAAAIIINIGGQPAYWVSKRVK